MYLVQECGLRAETFELNLIPRTLEEHLGQHQNALDSIVLRVRDTAPRRKPRPCYPGHHLVKTDLHVDFNCDISVETKVIR